MLTKHLLAGELNGDWYLAGGVFLSVRIKCTSYVLSHFLISGGLFGVSVIAVCTQTVLVSPECSVSLMVLRGEINLIELRPLFD